MGESLWRRVRNRVGYWLEDRPWAREFVLREDPSSGEFVEQPVERLIRVRAINRITGHVVMIERGPYSWKRDDYLVAASIGFMLGAIAMLVVGSLFVLAGAK